MRCRTRDVDCGRHACVAVRSRENRANRTVTRARPTRAGQIRETRTHVLGPGRESLAWALAGAVSPTQFAWLLVLGALPVFCNTVRYDWACVSLREAPLAVSSTNIGARARRVRRAHTAVRDRHMSRVPHRCFDAVSRSPCTTSILLPGCTLPGARKHFETEDPAVRERLALLPSDLDGYIHGGAPCACRNPGGGNGACEHSAINFASRSNFFYRTLNTTTSDRGQSGGRDRGVERSHCTARQRTSFV